MTGDAEFAPRMIRAEVPRTEPVEPIRPGLSMPEHLWCPRCKIHNRSKDVYGSTNSDSPTVLELYCPICADEVKNGASVACANHLGSLPCMNHDEHKGGDSRGGCVFISNNATYDRKEANEEGITHDD